MSSTDDALWQIAQQVAEIDSTFYGDEDIHGIPTCYICPFCGNEQKHEARIQDEDFPHAPICIVTKARELIEWRKAQQRTSDVTIHVELDGKVIAEHVAAVDVRKMLKSQQEKERERAIRIDMARQNCEE